MKSVWKIYLAIMLVIFTFAAIAVFLSLFIFWKPVNKSGNFPSNADSPASARIQPNSQEARENLVKENEPEFARSGYFLSLEGDDKDVLTIKTSNLTADEVETLVREELNAYKNAGFRQIVITGAGGIKKTLDLR